MKILNKIKKIFITMWIALIGFSTKVFCLNASDLPDGVNTVVPALYGPPRPSSLERVLNISKLLIVPVVLIIGLIMYFNKKSSKKVKKIGKVLITISLTLILLVLIVIGSISLVYIILYISN